VVGAATLQYDPSSSIAWLDGHLPLFAPVRGGQLLDRETKALAELALVHAYLHERVEVKQGHQVDRRWRSFIAEQCSESALAQMPLKRPRVAFAYLLPYLMLRAGGYRHSRYEDILDLLRESGLLHATEVTPYRSLERAHAYWKSGILDREPDWRRLVRQTTLGQLFERGSPRWSLDDEAVYSITHTLFYLTDFGGMPAELSPFEIASSVQILECQAVHYQRVGHWDLLGEVLINLTCLGAQLSPIYESALATFQSTRRPDGSVPPPRRSTPPTATEADRQEGFWRSYHSTLVAVLLGITTGRNLE
jgi:hypothetical protein